MKSLPMFCTALALGMTVTTGCSKQEDNVAKPQGAPGDIVASVDGVTFLRKDMDALIDRILAAQNVPEEQMQMQRTFLGQRLVNNFILKTLLTNEAKKEKIVVTPEDRQKQEARYAERLAANNKTLDQFFAESAIGEKAARQEYEDSIVIEKLIQVKILDHITINEEEVENTLRTLAQRNAEIEEANKKLPEANAAARAKLEDIKKQLAAGTDFAELAKANSDCPSKERGGDLGAFQRGQMVKPFEDAAFAQEVGKVGDIVETPFGYHLILVKEKKPATEATADAPATPETVTASHILLRTTMPEKPQPLPTADEVREALKNQQGSAPAQEYLESLKAKAKIVNVFDTEDDDDDAGDE